MSLIFPFYLQPQLLHLPGQVRNRPCNGEQAVHHVGGPHIAVAATAWCLTFNMESAMSKASEFRSRIAKVVASFEYIRPRLPRAGK